MGELHIEGLCKGWDFPVIDRLDLSVAEGEFFVVVGPSGIGKTTLLRLVAGLERCDAGRILVGGRDVTGLPPYRRNVAMTFESYALYPHLSVFENIASPLRARKLSRSEIETTVRQVTAMLRIDELLERRPGEISGGRSSAPHSPAPWSRSRRSISWTSRSATSTRASATSSASSSTTSRSSAGWPPST